MSKSSNKKWAIGAVVAGAAGYLAGILTAPKSGKETRADISDKSLAAKAEVEKSLKALHSELDILLGKAKAEVSKASESVKEDLKSAVTKAEVAKNKARTMLTALHDGKVEDPDLHTAISEAKKAIDHLKKFVKS